MYFLWTVILCLFQVAVIATGEQCIFQSRHDSLNFLRGYDLNPYSTEANVLKTSARSYFEEAISISATKSTADQEKIDNEMPKGTEKIKKKSGLFRISLYRTRYPPPPCSSHPCSHGSCRNIDMYTYRCDCNPGWTGTRCDTDVDECASNPCQYDATCNNLQDRYTCTCSEDYTGYDCDTDMCNPEEHGGADIAIVLDSSSSQSQTEFEKQKDFIKSLIKAFPIGVDEFRFSVTTYSSSPNVHFNLDTHLTNDSLLQAIDGIQNTGGASVLHEALSIIRNGIFGNITSTKTKYVLILGDGLMSNLRGVILEAGQLKADSVTLVSVGFGSQILHQGLIDAATGYSYVFPPTTGDLKNWLLRRHVMEECPDCSLYSSDVFLLLETSVDMDITRYYQMLNAFKTLIARTPISQGGVHVSLATFSETVTERFDFKTYFNSGDVIKHANSAFQETKSSNHTTALQYVRETAFISSKGVRQGFRKVAILFISEVILDLSSVLEHADSLKSNNVTVVVITVAMDTSLNISSLLQIVSDPAYLFVFGDSIYGDFSTSHVLLSLFRYDKCIFD